MECKIQCNEKQLAERVEYKIRSTEQTKAKCAEYETKALLYMMNMRIDSDDIYYFVIDFFNDLTGVDRYANKTWDLQSKGKSNNYQSDIGKELVTLYKNYVSNLSFNYFIIFLGGVVKSIRIDASLDIFDFNNIELKAQMKIKKALLEECNNKTYINDYDIESSKIDEFLSEVTFVIGNKRKSDYIKSIVKVNPLIIPKDEVLDKIFNQIRDVQSAKKNNNNVEGVIINEIKDFLHYSRHLKSSEIKMMVLNRIINNDIMQRGITKSFLPIYIKFPEDDKNELLDDCQNDLAKTIFDKNNSDNFWKLFGDIYSVVMKNRTLSIEESYKLLDQNILKQVKYLDILSVQYFMAVIKDGYYED